MKVQRERHFPPTNPPEVLVHAVRQLQRAPKPEPNEVWYSPPAVRLLDCVLSLRNRYDGFVVPRVRAFRSAHPTVRRISDLRDLIGRSTSPVEFLQREVNYRSVTRARVLFEVADWMTTEAGEGDEDVQAIRLSVWAKNASPRERPAIKNFGLAGFQYLRMLFGADTAKPDVHIIRWVEKQIGHRVSAIAALELLEQACDAAGLSVSEADAAIWNSGARAKSAA